jgi:hypothetical protein
MPLAGFELTIPVFKRAKTFHALDRAATVTGNLGVLPVEKLDFQWIGTINLTVYVEGLIRCLLSNYTPTGCNV